MSFTRDCLSLAVGIALALLFTGLSCAREGAPDRGALAVTDDMGRSLLLAGPVKRVVTLTPSLTELVFAAGAGNLLVGVSTADDYPPEVADLPRFSAYPLNVEAIAMLEPDLVLAVDQVNSVRHQAAFDALGIPVFYFSYPTVDSVWRSLERIGILLGTPSPAKAMADSFRQVINQRAQEAGARGVPGVLVLLDDRMLYSFGQSSYVTDLVSLAGARNISGSLQGDAVPLTEEFVLKADPELIIGAFGTSYDPQRLLALHPGWESLAAIRSGRICLVDPDWILRPGPRLVLGFTHISECLGAPGRPWTASSRAIRNP